MTTFAFAADDEYASVRDKIQLCNSCHGVDGKPIQPEYPIIAGQHFYYVYVQLKDFKSGLRKNEIMGPIAATLEKDEMKLIAKYFSEQTWPATGHHADSKYSQIAHKAIDAGECPACHLGGFEGYSRVPRLAGQHPAYLKKTMLDLKHERRMNAQPMAALFQSFSEEDITALAEYTATLTVHAETQNQEIR
ncbi:MAG: c-type cytochrome [Gammaproteobacteria bacterium]